MPRIHYVEKCSIEGCNDYTHARHMCQPHYRKWMRDGNFDYKRMPNGMAVAEEHIRVAEKALGRKLPTGAVVHHLDEDKSNNTPTNLVICPSQSYHMTIHNRMRKFGNPFR